MTLRLMLGRAAAVAALTAAPLAIASSAHAASYDGQDPIASGCSSSAITARSAAIYRGDGAQVGTIELRYSTSCHTAWARILTPYSTGAAYVFRNGGGVESCPSSGNALTWSSSLGAYTCYTPMLNDAGSITSYADGVVDGWWGVSSNATASF